MKRTGEKGFTLLELLVVVAIISALAGIAIPQYSRYKANAEKASMLSDCRSLYRAFVIYYLEYQEYPFATSGDANFIFNKETFKPLTVSALMGGIPFDIDLDAFRDKLDGRKAETFDSPDDMGTNQEFYLVLPWVKDPSIKFVVASSDAIKDGDGVNIDSGNWLDGVYIAQNGKIIGP